MAFDINKFYADLDAHYARYDNAATEQFLKDSLAMSEEYMIIPSSCGSCDDHCDRTGEEKYDQLSDHEKEWIINCSDTRIAVLNEMACFYRGLSQWDKCLTAFDAVKAELEIRGMQNNSAYAVVILNMAGALRLMGKFEEALASCTGDIVVCMHQNLDPAIPENHRLSNDAALRALLEAYGVKHVISGHYHPGADNTVVGVHYLTLPALCERETADAIRILELS